MLYNWKLIKKEDYAIISNNLKNKYFVEYFNSFIYQIYNKMVYKIIENSLIICKPNTMMGNYNFIRYCDTNIKEDINKNLLEYGFTLRGTDIKGKKDKFGNEYIYCTKTCVEKKGKSFSRFRNILNRYKLGIDTIYKIGYHEDIDNVVKKWSLMNKSKHQIKLLNTIKDHLDIVNITRIYYNNQIVGFSIVEIINKNNGIIIQRLIHPDIKSIIIEPNILIHYCDCLNNPNMFLNIGASRNKNIKIAKNKLVPFHFLRINRLTSKKKFTKEDWYYFKNNLQ